MSKEEIIERLTTHKKYDLYTIIRQFKKEGIENFIITRPELVQGLLELYNKEKEKNEDNSEWITNLSKEVDRCHNVITSLQKIIENINTNTKIVDSSKEYNKWLNENYISKDKIKETFKQFTRIAFDTADDYAFVDRVCKDLLEEDNK